MNFLALLALIMNALYLFTPGSQYKTKPVLDWSSPKPYMAIIAFFSAMALCVWVFVT